MIHKQTYRDKIVWIIGASSGIGAALAEELASRGATLVLSARRMGELEHFKNSLPGSNHEVFTLDVSDVEAVNQVSDAINARFASIHSIVFLAAAYTPMKLESLDIVATREMIETNLLGAFHVVQAVIPILKKQISGQIVLCGSVAGYYGLPGGQPYSATKAGIINLAESLRSELPKSIDVKLISPGFVRTPLTDKNNFYMPMMIEPFQAAFLIADALLKKGFEVSFPKPVSYWLRLLQLLPYKLSLKITSKLNR